VYARKVKEQALTFVVSGMLWNRSLVMMDQETKSLWSHILGRAMQGDLEGTELESLPSVMATWGTWKREHPETTVLNMSRKKDRFTREFYKDFSEFVYGWMLGRQAYHCTFEVLQAHPILNLDFDGWPVLVTYDPESTGVQMLNRQVENRKLRFEAEGKHLMRDRETGSVWNRNTGMALEGPLRGKHLEHEIGMMSYKKAWDVFHPDSRAVTQKDRVGEK